MRYAYLGDRHTRDDLRGRRCDPVKNERGVCVVGGSKQLVQFDDGEVAVVLRRRLRRI